MHCEICGTDKGVESVSMRLLHNATFKTKQRWEETQVYMESVSYQRLELDVCRHCLEPMSLREMVGV